MFVRDFGKRVPQENLENVSGKRIVNNPKSNLRLKNKDDEELNKRRKDVLRMNQIYGEYEDIMMTESSNKQSVASIIFFFFLFLFFQHLSLTLQIN